MADPEPDYERFSGTIVGATVIYDGREIPYVDYLRIPDAERRASAERARAKAPAFSWPNVSERGEVIP